MGDSLVEKMAEAIHASRGYYMCGTWDEMKDRFIGADKKPNCWQGVYKECIKSAKAALTALSTAELDDKALEAADEVYWQCEEDRTLNSSEEMFRAKRVIQAYLQHLARPYEGK